MRGPAIIGARTVVVDSYIGPFTAIGADCEVVGSEVEHAVVMDESRIERVPRLIDSLLGKHVEVVRSEQRPRATRLMLGDHSTVDLS